MTTSELQSHPHVIGAISTDTQDKDGPWEVEAYSDSDWAGCLETRRSTDSHVIIVHAVIQVTTQTQPGLPATSSPDAEFRGVSRTARETIFVRELLENDFGISCSKPGLWTDSSSAMQASKRIGPGTKLRHLDLCEFYVQGAIQAKLLSLAKVKGAVNLNCANFCHQTSKERRRGAAALPSLGMYEEREDGEMLSEAYRVNVKVGKVGVSHKWKSETRRNQPPRCGGGYLRT